MWSITVASITLAEYVNSAGIFYLASEIIFAKTNFAKYLLNSCI